MANTFTAFASALYGYIDNASTANIYYGLAPQGTQPPYIIIQRVTSDDEYTFTSQGVDTQYSVKAVSNRNYPMQATTLYESIHSILQNANLTISGYSLLRCERSSEFDYQDKDQFWHVGGIYSIQAWQS